VRWLQTCFFRLTGVCHGHIPLDNVCTGVHLSERSGGGGDPLERPPIVANRWLRRRVARPVLTLVAAVDDSNVDIQIALLATQLAPDLTVVVRVGDERVLVVY